MVGVRNGWLVAAYSAPLAPFQIHWSHTRSEFMRMPFFAEVRQSSLASLPCMKMMLTVPGVVPLRAVLDSTTAQLCIMLENERCRWA